MCYNALYCRRQDIIKHMRSAHQCEGIQPEEYLIKDIEEVNFSCTICGAKSLLSQYCNIHRAKSQKATEIHTCHLCSIGFKDKMILQAHINIDHGREIHNNPQFECYICRSCRQVYVDNRIFLTHMRETHAIIVENTSVYVINSLKQILNSCKCCHEPCVFSSFCREHDANVSIDNCSEHPERHSCESCNVLYNDCNDLWSHMFSQHIGETLYCNLCGNSSDSIIRTPNVLMKHRRRVHGPRSLEDKELLLKYQVVVDGETKKYCCCECSCVLPNFDKLREHFEKSHKRKSKFSCDICKKHFRAKKNLEGHFRKNHVEISHSTTKNHACSICGISFFQARRLQAHYTSVHTAEVNEITIDSHTSNSNCNLIKSQVEILEGNRKKYKCPLCDRVYTSFSETKRHFEIHSGERKYTCSICTKSFFIKNRLSEHYRRVHLMKVSMARTNDTKKKAETIGEDGLVKYKCHVCNAMFKRYDSLRFHLRGHTGDRPYTCDVCGKSFVAKKHLTRHYNCSHAGFGYQCNICGRVMSDSTNFKDHLDNHKGEKKYTCEICGTGFMYKSSLHHHKFSHSKERMFQCSFCEKKYMSPKTLKEHEQTHRSGNVKHICNTCGSEFNTRKNMLRHTKVHSTERPYVCEYCSITFKERKSLVRHYKIHNKAIPTSLM